MPVNLLTSWLGAVEEVDLRLDLCLRPGRHLVAVFPGRPALRLGAGRRATARFDAHLSCDGTGYVLESGRAVFVPALRIHNPKSTLQPGHALINVLGDLVADLEIPSVRVDKDGRIEPEVVRRVFWLFRSPQLLTAEDQARLQLPVPLYALSGPASTTQASGRIDGAPASSASGSEQSSAATLFDSATRLLEEARVTVAGMSRALEIPGLPVPLSPGRVTLHFDAELHSDSEEPGLRVVVARPAAPQLECDLMRARLSADGRLRGEADAIVGRGCLKVEVELRDNPLFVVAGTIRGDLHVQELTFSKSSKRLRGKLDLAIDLPQLSDEAPFEAKDIPVGIEFLPDGLVRAEPITGVLDAFEQWVDLNGDVTRVRDPLAPAAGSKGSAEVRSAIAQRTKAASRAGNRVELLVDGCQSYPKRLELIESATRSIHVQTLIFADDESGTDIAERLAAKARAGVDVRVIIDALGNVDPSNPLGTVGGRRVYDVMDDAGVELRLYNPLNGEALRTLLDQVKGEAMATGGLADLRDPVALVGGLGRLLQQAKSHTPAPVLVALLEKMSKASSTLMKGRSLPRQSWKSTDATMLPTLDADDLKWLVRYAATINHRWHEKYLIVDEHKLIMGGLNIADEYNFGGRPESTVAGDRPAWRDTDVYIEGPAVLDALRSFADNWYDLTGQDLTVPNPQNAEPAGHAIVQMIQHRPREDQDHHILSAVLEHLASLDSGDRALFANAYFLPVGGLAPLQTGLEAAARRGVDVRIVTNSASTTDAPQVNHAAVFAQRQLLEAGARLFERKGNRTMHSKFAVLGDEVVAIGSWNMDNRSESLNSEGLALIHDRALADHAAETIEADMAADVAVELQLESGAMRGQKLEDELRSLGLCAFGELL